MLKELHETWHVSWHPVLNGSAKSYWMQKANMELTFKHSENIPIAIRLLSEQQTFGKSCFFRCYSRQKPSPILNDVLPRLQSLKQADEHLEMEMGLCSLLKASTDWGGGREEITDVYGSEMALPANSMAMLCIYNSPLVGASKEGFSVRLPPISRLNLDSLVLFWNTNELITEHK